MLGIKPRTIEGALGILTAPVLHGDFYHLISNLFPLILAIPGLFYFFYKEAIPVMVVVYLLSGFWVWLSARDSVHLGASGVVNGLLAFLFFSGIFQMKRSGYALAAAILFLYGIPVISGFFPSPGISYESHIAGATAGAFMAIYYAIDINRPAQNKNYCLDSTSEEKITFQYHYKPKNESEENIS